jgi:endonuclease/exonuclease/phosphatase family metal-dependent hydrolase
LLRDPAQATPPRDGVVVMAYNVERGLRADEQIEALTNDPAMPAPDVILMSEADRGCERTACRNVARDWAKALSMNYVYGVEFVELPRLWGPAGGRLRRRCEHGNAILSRYPLGNVRLIRHDVNRSWHSCWQRLFRVGEPRLGGRMALAADVKLGERYLRLYSVHFESQGGQAYRPAQAVELAEAGLGSPHGVLVGGDMNCVEYREDLASGSATDGVTQALLGQGYADAHSAMAPEQRATSRSGYPIDLIFGRGVSFAGAGIGDKGAWGELSDHLPVWARVGVG